MPWSLIVIVFALPLQVYFGVSAIGGALRVYQDQREIAAVRADLDRLQQRRQDLEKQVLYLQSDQYIEKVAREELNLVKPGDQAVVIIPGERSAIPVSTGGNGAGKAEAARSSAGGLPSLIDRFFGPGESSSDPGRP